MRRAKIAIRIMDSPVRFIGTVQLGITAFSILLGIVAEPLVANWIDGPLSHGVAFVLAYAFVIPARDARRARAEGHCADEERGDGTLGGVSDRGRLRHLLPHRVVLPGVRQRDDEARGHRAGAGRRHRPLRGGHPPHHGARRGDRRDRGRGARDALQGLRLRRQGGRRRDGASAERRGVVHRAAAGGVPSRRHGGALHAVSRVSRFPGQCHRHPPHPRPHA